MLENYSTLTYTSALPRDSVHTSQVRSQDLGDQHRAIPLLEGLQDRHQRSAHRKAGPIQRVHEVGFAMLTTIANISTSRLERFTVTAGRNLAKRALRGYPDFQVVAFGRREPHIPGAQRDHAIRQPQPLQHRLSRFSQPLELLIRLFRS